MTFSRAQINTALRYAEKQIKVEQAQKKRFNALRSDGVRNMETVTRLTPAILAKKPLPVRKVQLALEHMGFDRPSITKGIWAAIGAHTVDMNKDFVLRKSA